MTGSTNEDVALKFKLVLRLDRIARLLRVARWMWDCGTVGDGSGYSTKVSVALCPKLFGFYREFDGWVLVVAGVRIHYARSFGGRFV